MVFSKLFQKSQEIKNNNKEKQQQQRNETVPTTKTINNRTQGQQNGKKRRRGAKSNNNDEKNSKNNFFLDNQKSSTSLLPQHKTKKHKNNSSFKSHTKGPPSLEALNLSEKLRDLSRNKNLTGALELYWDKSNDSIRDGHHACIVVDCCGRCGNISEGEKIIQEMEKSDLHVNVETKTALLKGYSLSGMISKAEDIFFSMCEAKAKRDLPNNRSLNTLLRGCLWSAAIPKENGNENLCGGVVTSEKAWSMCKKLQEEKKIDSIFDVSSYEYSICLLCQALRTSDALTRIDDMKKKFLIDTTDDDDDNNNDNENIDQGVTETLAISYLALGRAYSILNEQDKVKDACKKSLKFVALSKKALAKGTVAASGKTGARNKQNVDSNNRRAESNAIFREHRLGEVEREARAMIDICKEESNIIMDARQTSRRLLTRLIVLSGGGTTQDDDKDDSSRSINSDTILDRTQQQKEHHQHQNDNISSNLQMQIVNTAYYSYGFDALSKKLNIPMREGVNVLTKKDCNRLLGCIGLQGGIVQDDGTIDFHKVFSAGIGDQKGRRRKRKKKGTQQMEIELGAGFGDWIVKKAMDNPTIHFLSVELRADRVGQTFARTAALANVNPVDNLCIVGAESCSFLLNQVKDESVTTIYVNHPEPPTQTFGLDADGLKSIAEGGLEPSHMLNSKMMIAASKCLANNDQSRIIIVTDNRWYGRLICATLVKVRKQCGDLLVPIDLEKMNGGFELVETFPEQRDGVVGSTGSFGLFQGQPNSYIGHPDPAVDAEGSSGASYFDRLWRSGGGTHAEKYTRFVIALGRR